MIVSLFICLYYYIYCMTTGRFNYWYLDPVLMGAILFDVAEICLKLNEI